MIRPALQQCRIYLTWMLLDKVYLLQSECQVLLPLEHLLLELLEDHGRCLCVSSTCVLKQLLQLFPLDVLSGLWYSKAVEECQLRVEILEDTLVVHLLWLRGDSPSYVEVSRDWIELFVKIAEFQIMWICHYSHFIAVWLLVHRLFAWSYCCLVYNRRWSIDKRHFASGNYAIFVGALTGLKSHLLQGWVSLIISGAFSFYCCAVVLE